MPRAWIGTSGWAYDEWGPTFYAQLPRARWLEHGLHSLDFAGIRRRPLWDVLTLLLLAGATGVTVTDQGRPLHS